MKEENYRRAKEIREELAFIGRYQDGISPKLQKYKELEARKALLRLELKQLDIPEAGSNPAKMKSKLRIKAID